MNDTTNNKTFAVQLTIPELLELIKLVCVNMQDEPSKDTLERLNYLYKRYEKISENGGVAEETVEQPKTTSGW